VGVTSAQVRDLVRAAKAAKTVFTAGQQMRSYQQLVEAVRKIREGVIGDVMWVKAQRHAPADLAHDGSSGDWYFDVAKSGGYLIEQSVHNLDACNWAIGAIPQRACGFGGTQRYKNDPPGRTIFDCASLTYDYPNGVKLSFTQNVFHPRTLPSGGQYIHVFGTKGAVDLLTAATMHTLDRQGAPVVLAEKREESRHAHLTAFYDAITKGGPNPAGITIGATAALTAILGHLAMVRETVVHWRDLGVEL
jgi:predicted dehydrogenase